jgi:hypothetical protein
MKTNFTLTAVITFVVLTFVTLFTRAQVTSQFNFSATPILISGTANEVGAQYRFSNVATGTDALVTIASATGGAYVDIFDDNDLTMPEAFSPRVHIPAFSTGLVSFKFDFVKAGTTTGFNQDSINVTAIDIDGGAELKEIDMIEVGGGTMEYMAANPEISVTQNGNVFTAKNMAGNEYPSVDTSAKVVMFTVKKTNVKTFTYSCGAENNSAAGISRQKSTYFKSFNYAGSLLPVKYTSFDAVTTENTVNLKWTTENEINNHHYEVEQSLNGTTFKTIGLVLDAENPSSLTKTYRFKDYVAGATAVYYRLKQVDNDGKFSYSNVLAVRFKAADVTMQVSPNPFVENLNVRFAATSYAAAEVQIISANGQKVMVQQTTVTKGYNTVQVNGLSKLAPGMYVAQLIINGTVTATQKIIKN